MTDAAARKEVIDEAPEGYHYEWCVDESWRIGGNGRKCRMLRCQNQAVAAFDRKHGKFRVWWHYCESHLYGRKIQDGKVIQRILVEDSSPSPDADSTKGTLNERT